uniref:Uncharacterized protein n=1 Tax=Solanum tuberosum TaxID=4113 RepID=M1CJS0_SOLTU
MCDVNKYTNTSPLQAARLFSSRCTWRKKDYPKDLDSKIIHRITYYNRSCYFI